MEGMPFFCFVFLLIGVKVALCIKTPKIVPVPKPSF